MLKNKKGATLVTVVIIVTVLVLLGSILMDIVLNNLVLTKRHMNIDFAYYAGESAIENWISVINSQLKGDSITSSYAGDVTLSNQGSIENYAEHIVQKIKDSNKLEDLWIDVSNESDKLVATAASATSAHVDFIDIVLEDTKWDSSMGNSMDIYIGIKAKSSFSLPDTSYKTGNKEVYAIKPFRVQCPSRNFLESAIWAVGDFYINGNLGAPNEGTRSSHVAKVKGDVYTFGSYGANTNDMKQELFGGIYALNGGMLNVYGNAYSRSFIRTGPYATENDNSEIKIYKDSIAQCIQAFGDGDKIIGLRNAYTFDDLEINGENSVVAINGSFFGLARGGQNSNHDESSAIVNSTVIHSIKRWGSIPGADPSFRSRVVINGDVILGGATMKIDTDTNIVQGPIENASLAYNNTAGVPQYKLYDDWLDAEGYHDFLRGASDIYCGLNQFQVWDIVSPYNSAGIEGWIKGMDDERNGLRGYGKTIEESIKGWWQYEIVGNGKLYPNDKIDPDNKLFSNDYVVKKDDPNIGTYRLDNIFNEDGTIKYGKNQWNFDLHGTSKDKIVYEGTEYDVRDFLFGKITVDPDLPGICNEFKRELEAKVNRFVERDYLKTASSSMWDVNPTDEFHKILVALETKFDQASGEDKKHILYLDSGTGNEDIKDLFDTEYGIPDIYDICADSRVDAVNGDIQYYLVANANPDLDLEISGAFNGIIVTAGKIHLMDNASVYGSIIAAGNGEYRDYNGDVILDANGNPTFFPRAKAVSHGEVDNLNNGDYAAVIISISDGDDAGSDINPPYVDFYLGLAGDESSEYTEADLQKVVDTAVDENGYFMPEDTEGDELVYLNRAARVNLLEKFMKWNINLYDIF